MFFLKTNKNEVFCQTSFSFIVNVLLIVKCGKREHWHWTPGLLLSVGSLYVSGSSRSNWLQRTFNYSIQRTCGWLLERESLSCTSLLLVIHILYLYVCVYVRVNIYSSVLRYMTDHRSSEIWLIRVDIHFNCIVLIRVKDNFRRYI